MARASAPSAAGCSSRAQAAWHTVVGVVEDVMQYGFRDTPQAVVYFPLVGPTPTSWYHHDARAT